MLVKTDTKEKFTVISPEEQHISANMAEEFRQMIMNHAQEQPPHVIINFSKVESVAPEVVYMLTESNEKFYAEHHSFVICCLNDEVMGQVSQNEYSDTLNITPTESEAWDIVQMEEIERELLADFDEEDPS